MNRCNTLANSQTLFLWHARLNGLLEQTSKGECVEDRIIFRQPTPFLHCCKGLRQLQHSSVSATTVVPHRSVDVLHGCLLADARVQPVEFFLAPAQKHSWRRRGGCWEDNCCFGGSFFLQQYVQGFRIVNCCKRFATQISRGLTILSYLKCTMLWQTWKQREKTKL